MSVTPDHLLTDAQRALAAENIARCRAYKAQKDAPKPPESLLDLVPITNQTPQRPGESAAARDQHATLSGNAERTPKPARNRFSRVA
jgi:hypothetical protein